MQAALLAVVSATASLLAHRLFCAVAVQTARRLGSKDVSGAFLQGLSFEELAQEKHEIVREVFFTLPDTESWQLLYELDNEALALLATTFLELLLLQALKGGYGLKDAPRLWRKRLHHFLTRRLRFTQSLWDECVYHLYPHWVVEKQRRADLSVNRELEELIDHWRRQPEAAPIDPSKPLAVLSVNTHVDDLEHCGTPAAEAWFASSLDAEFGECKSQSGSWTHVGSDHVQSTDLRQIFVHQRPYGEKLGFISVSKERRRQKAEPCTATEGTSFKASAGSLGWYLRQRLDLISTVRELQCQFGAPHVRDLLQANVVVRKVHDSLDVGICYRPLPPGATVLQVWSDGAKGETGGKGMPVIGTLVLWTPSVAKRRTLDGPALTLDGQGKQSTRQAKSSLHIEAVAANAAIERGQKISCALGEFYLEPVPIKVALAQVEAGRLPFSLELIIDAKCLYDLLMSTSRPKTADEGSLQYVHWLKDRFDAGALSGVTWCSTHDQLSDILTKSSVDPWLLRQVMMDNKIELIWSALRNGVVLNAEKGLPPPKSGKDAAAVAFLEAFHAAGASWETFVALLGNLPDGDPAGNSCRSNPGFGWQGECDEE